MSSSEKFKMNDGDWICPDTQCSNVNFARRSTCNRCGKEKTSIPSRKKLGHEIGKAAAEKSRGLFSADDWQCGRCGNVNWARRSTCNMCNAPKFGDVEERTGLGGGYNERENVEYIQREDSDGEYDEFGRRKKKDKGKEIPKFNKSIVEEEEEEEEDDDEDGDLSKYDLTGWGDDDEEEQDKTDKDNKNDKTTTNDKPGSRSSSRSRSSSKSRSSTSRSSSSDSEGSRSKKRRGSRSRSSSPSSKKRTRRESSSSRSPSSSRSRDRSKSGSPIRKKK